MRKVTIFLICCLCFVTLSAPLSASAAYVPEKDVNSETAYMVNIDTGTVIFKKDENKKMYPASFTKIMTFIVATEALKGQDLKGVMVTAPSYIYDELYGLGASTADIRQGEKVSMYDLLHAMLIPSACEAASIVADYVGKGSIPKFVEQMNAKAKALGANNSHFVNAHGLHNPDQLSTAYDMYLITREAMKNPLFMEICSKSRYTMTPTEKHPASSKWIITNTNWMMDKVLGGTKYYYPYVKGIKTGTTDESGKNLITSAAKDGYNYLLVTMGAPVKYPNGDKINDILSFIDHKSLYAWAFDKYKVKTVLKANETIQEVKLKNCWGTDHMLLAPAKDVTALLPSDVDVTSIQRIPQVPSEIKAPIQKGDKVGTVKLKLADETFLTVDLVATADAKRSTLLFVWNGILSVFSSFWFKLAVILCILAVGGYIVFMISVNKKRKKYKVIKRKRRF